MSDTQNVEQEVRFAIVLYGGVSLAIYINGVVQEIRNLIRATSGTPLSTDEAGGPIPVYQRLASILERGKIPSGELPATDGQNRPIRTRFKVDRWIVDFTSVSQMNALRRITGATPQGSV